MKNKATINGVEIEEGSGNPYADIGYPDANEMLIKAKLMHEIARILKSRKLTRHNAAVLLDIPQPQLSEILLGKFRDVREAKMMECLNRLGRDVDIVVKKTGRNASGHTQVVVA